MVIKGNKLEITYIATIWLIVSGNFIKNQKNGEIYNIGGGRYSNCSIIEALNYVEEISKINIKKKILKTPRVGDHIWYISDTSKFKKHYPKWKQRYNTKKIIEELIEHQK